MALVIGVCAGLAIWAVWRDRFSRLRMWLLLFLGLVAVGKLRAIDQKTVDSVAHVGATLTDKVVGYGVGIILIAVLIACEFWDRAAPRTGSGGGRFAHSIMALVAPQVFVTAGGVFALAMGWGADLLTTVPQTMNSLF